MIRRLVPFVLVLALAGATFPAALRLAGAQSPTVVKIGVLPAEVAAEAFYGLDMGFFRKAGLDVQLQFFSNGGAIAAAVAGGALDLGLSDLMSVVNAHVHDVPFTYLAPGLQHSVAAPSFAIVVPRDSPVRGPKDLQGPFGVSGLNNIAQISVQGWVDRNGGNAKAVRFVEVPTGAVVAELEQGALQAATANEPWLTAAIEAGDRVIYMDKNPIAPAFMLSGWVVTRDWLTRNPGTAAKLIAAMRETAVWANHNRDLSAPILAKYAKIPLEKIARFHRGTFGESFNLGLIQPVIDAAATYGAIPRGFPAAEIVYVPR
jgi:NitT/TauT family transport system substrate-binding protein